MKTKTMGLFLFTVFFKTSFLLKTTHTFGFISFCYEEHKILNSENTKYFLCFQK